MRKTFTGPNREREAIYKKVGAWIESQKGLIKQIQVSETLVRSINPRSFAPKAQGDLTVMVTYEKSNRRLPKSAHP
jgi:hypothetical protein